MTKTPAEIAAGLTEAQRRALYTRGGHGDFSSKTFKRLLELGLVDGSYYFTDLAFAVREHLEKK